MLKSEVIQLEELNKGYANNGSLLRYLDLYIRREQEELEGIMLEREIPAHYVNHLHAKIQGMTQLRMSLEREVVE